MKLFLSAYYNMIVDLPFILGPTRPLGNYKLDTANPAVENVKGCIYITVALNVLDKLLDGWKVSKV